MQHYLSAMGLGPSEGAAAEGMEIVLIFLLQQILVSDSQALQEKSHKNNPQLGVSLQRCF